MAKSPTRASAAPIPEKPTLPALRTAAAGLGATAAQGILGSQFLVTQQRGQWVQSNIASQVMATVHPSSILRAPDDDSRHEEMAKFVADFSWLI